MHKEAKESISVEQTDAVPITVSGKVGEVVPHHEEDYATIDEVEHKQKKNRFLKKKKESPANDEKPVDKKGEDPVYAVVKKVPRTEETV